MPSYRVIDKGFYGGVSYSPDGKRNVLVTGKPFFKKDGEEQVPMWLKPMKESKAKQAQRRTAQKAAAENAAKVKETDDAEVKSASFLAAGDKSSIVETL